MVMPAEISESATECDIGKILHLRSGSLRDLSREEKYCILSKDPNSDVSVYPRTRPYGSGAFRQFQPSWLAQFPHYSIHFVIGVFVGHVQFLLQKCVGGAYTWSDVCLYQWFTFPSTIISLDK